MIPARHWPLSFVAVLALLLAGCGGGRHDTSTGDASAGLPSDGPGSVVSATDVAVVSKSALDASASAAGIADLAGPAACDVLVRSVVHRTTGPGGVAARNSAALLVPQAGAGCSGPFPLLAYARGTSADRSRTLANPDDRETRALMMLLAARGFMVVATDYLGFGQSDFPYSPYLDASSEASSVIDSIVAARVVASSTGIALRRGVFLTGYSLGGHAILAAQRQAEQTPIADTPILAVGAMSGPYDLGVTLSGALQLAVLPSLGDQAAGVAASPAVLLLANAVTAVANRFLGLDAVRDALARESVIGWRPVAPLMLCGGARDPVVPWANTTTAAADFSARGAAPVVVDVDADPAYAARVPAQGTPVDAVANYHAQIVPPLCVQAVRDRLFALVR